MIKGNLKIKVDLMNFALTLIKLTVMITVSTMIDLCESSVNQHF